MATEKAAATDNEFEEVPDTYAEPWKEPVKGQSIMGVYRGAQPVKKDNPLPGQSPFFNAHVLEKADGTLISVAGGSIDSRMARIPHGVKVKVTFDGTQKHKSGGQMKLFTVVAAKGTQLKPISFKSNDEFAE